MRNYIILNGQNSNSISGLLIQSLAPISKPLMRTEVEEIDGRDGDITTKLGYSAYDKEITIGLYGNFDINEVIAYFNSEGTVIFSNEPDKYYNYQIAAQIDFERLVRYKTATVTMHCQPFKYSATEGTEIFGASSNLVTIPDFSKTTNGITVTASDGLMTVSGKGSAATEFYVPIDTLSLEAGSYTMTAVGSGTAPEACSLRVIYDSPSSANSFGGNYVTLKNNTDVSLSATLTATKTYNYIYLYISANKSMNFTLNLQIVDQAQAIVSGEGTELVLENTAEAPMDVTLKGNTEQDGTPTPSAPVPVQTVTGENVVKITGKNLFDSSKIIVGDIQNANPTIRLHSSQVLWLEAGTYTFSTNLPTPLRYSLSATDGGYPPYAVWPTWDYNSGWQDSARTTTFTLTKGGYFNVQFSKLNNGTLTLGEFTPYNYQLELGSTATDFEPYQSQSYEVNLGKNLFDKDNANIFNGYLGSSGIVEAANARAVYIPVVAGQTYTFSRANSTSQVNDPYYAFIANEPVGGGQYLEGRHAVGQHSLTFTGTAPAGSKYLIFYFAWNPSAETLATILSTYQLELGSQATSYAPYFTPIELCKIGTYQDYIYKSGGKWYVRKEVGKITLDGSLDESIVSGGTATSGKNRFNITVSGVANISGSEVASYSDNFVGVTRNDTWNCVQGVALGQNLVQIYCEATSGYDLDQFRAWLGSHNTTVYYALATPVDEEITNEALIEQLDDIYYHAHAYKVRTHVNSSAATGNVPHILAVQVTANMGDITVTNSGNFISKPTMTIFGSGDIGVYLNGIQLFQIALGDTEYITIDCAAMEAYKDTLETLQNRLVTGDYSNFVLNPGDNTISFSGSVTKFEISNYSRWL